MTYITDILATLDYAVLRPKNETKIKIIEKNDIKQELKKEQ
jgi:flagellar biosynthesis protein FlhB